MDTLQNLLRLGSRVAVVLLTLLLITGLAVAQNNKITVQDQISPAQSSEEAQKAFFAELKAKFALDISSITDAQADSDAQKLFDQLKAKKEVTYPSDITTARIFNAKVAAGYAIQRVRPDGLVSVEMNEAINETQRFLDLQCLFVTAYDKARNGVFIGEGALKMKILQSYRIVYDDNVSIPCTIIQIEVFGTNRQFGLNASYLKDRATDSEVGSWVTDVPMFVTNKDKSSAYAEFNNLVRRGIDVNHVDSIVSKAGPKRDLFPIGGPTYSGIFFEYIGGFDSIYDSNKNLINIKEGGSRLTFILLQAGSDVNFKDLK